MGYEAPYPTFTVPNKSTEQARRVDDNGDGSLNDSYFSNVNQSYSRDNTPSFDDFGAENYNPNAQLQLEKRARNGNSTATGPPTPEFQFAIPLDRQRPPASSTPIPNARPFEVQLQPPEQLPELLERPGTVGIWYSNG